MITPYILFYLALQGTPFEFTKGDSAKAMYMYVFPEPFLAVVVPLNLKPFDKKSVSYEDDVVSVSYVLENKEVSTALKVSLLLS
jgi:hypothetical protein